MPKPGYLSPSSFADLMSRGRGGEEFGLTAHRVIDSLVLDLMGVEPNEGESTAPSLMWGIEHEWEAIQLYQDRTFRHVLAPVPFTVSKTHPYVGGTMDGLVGASGGIEVKSPYNSTEHLHNLQTGRQLHKLYWYQVQGYFWIYELDWIDFVSYDPRFPEADQLYIERAYPDNKVIDSLKQRCEAAYEIAVEKVKKMTGVA